MSSNLPSPIEEGRGMRTGYDGPMPSTIRRTALRQMPAVMRRLNEIVHDEESKKHHVIAASKLVAEIAAVTKMTSIPRDLVAEKTVQTAAFLRDQLGDAEYARLADGLSAIWDL